MFIERVTKKATVVKVGSKLVIKPNKLRSALFKELTERYKIVSFTTSQESDSDTDITDVIVLMGDNIDYALLRTLSSESQGVNLIVTGDSIPEVDINTASLYGFEYKDMQSVITMLGGNDEL